MRPRQVHSPEYQVLTQHLKRARLHPVEGGKKLTQVELGQRLGKLQSYVNKVENAERELNVLELVSYCKALGVDFFEFMQKILQETESLEEPQNSEK